MRPQRFEQSGTAPVRNAEGLGGIWQRVVDGEISEVELETNSMALMLSPDCIVDTSEELVVQIGLEVAIDGQPNSTIRLCYPVAGLESLVAAVGGLK